MAHSLDGNPILRLDSHLLTIILISPICMTIINLEINTSFIRNIILRYIVKVLFDKLTETKIKSISDLRFNFIHLNSSHIINTLLTTLSNIINHRLDEQINEGHTFFFS